MILPHCTHIGHIVPDSKVNTYAIWTEKEAEKHDKGKLMVYVPQFSVCVRQLDHNFKVI